MRRSRPPLRSASRTTSPPLDGGEEALAEIVGTLPLPPPGGEVAQRDGVGDGATRSRRTAGTTKRARQLRQSGNEAEALLWLELKRRGLGGFKFIRQFPIGSYFADFACRERRLVVEIDGSQHADSAYDRRRDEDMRQRGFSILRFWSIDILKQRAAVCETILAALDGRLSENVAAPDLRYVHTVNPPTSKTGTTP